MSSLQLEKGFTLYRDDQRVEVIDQMFSNENAFQLIYGSVCQAAT